MPRRQRPLIRDSDTVRDASLIVIASEDTHAVERYFGRFRPRRVKFRILPTEEGRSSPQAILDRLDAYRNEFQIGGDDELWYCGDTDHWITGNHLPNLHRVLSHCHHQDYFVALSNPCFELWLLLHFEEPPDLPLNCTAVRERLRAVAGGYSKPNGCVAKITEEHVRHAIARAELADTAPSVPNNPSTRVHRIVKSMADRQSIALR
jgi:hypothetical protein